jgi:imipenem/basic amino acid-specific outer membrane pore
MKLAKLSLAAMVVAGLASSSFAADTLADAFKNGKVSGELKAWYFDQSADQSNGRMNNSNITTAGLNLGYVTDAFYGFKLGTTFQGAGNVGSAETGAKTTFKNDEYTGGGVLSEAYIAYTLSKTTVKVGRQFIATPLVSGSGSRMFTEAFEGAVIINTDLPQTTLIGGYVDRFQGRTSSVSENKKANPAISADATTDNGDAPTFKKSAAFTGGASGGLTTTFDDAYTLGVINKSISNLTLTAQYAIVKDVANVDDVDVYYTEANYVLPMSSFKLGFDANFRGSKTGSDLDALNVEGTYTAGRVSISELAGFGASFAYGTVSKSDSVIAGMGNGPTSYTSTMIRGTSTRMMADTDSYLFAATYDFSKIGVAGLTALAQYGWTSEGKNAKILSTASTAALGATTGAADYTNIAFGLTYAVPALKGLTTSLQYETQEKETKATNAKADTDELWFKAGYKF